MDPTTTDAAGTDPRDEADAATTSALTAAGIDVDAEIDTTRSGNGASGSGTRAMRGLFDRVPTRLTLALMVGTAVGIMIAAAARAILGAASTLVINLVVALFLSFGLEPAVKWLADRGMRRGLATGLVFVAGFLITFGFFAAMLPLILDQGGTLVNNADQILGGLIDNAARLPGEVGTGIAEWLTEFEQELPNRVPEYLENMGQGAISVGASVLGSLFNLLTIALVTFYMTADAPKLRAVVTSRMRPARQEEFLSIWEVAIDKTGGYVYSRVLTLVVSTIFHSIAFTVIGLDYPVALGFWVGVVSSLIPVIGTYIAGILPVIVALAGQPTDVIWVLVALTLYQGAENYLIAPRITAHTLSLNPAVTFVSVLLGASLMGAFGALLAIPVAAIIAALFSATAEAHAPHPDEGGDDPPTAGAERGGPASNDDSSDEIDVAVVELADEAPSRGAEGQRERRDGG
ncbi:MAG TPA: AI-2E family transporter [Nitriliruptoraceae bacterium]|nr:AI-2E family transporter [Nitriliruptoraceae bacterium]